MKIGHKEIACFQVPIPESQTDVGIIIIRLNRIKLVVQVFYTVHRYTDTIFSFH